MNETPLEDQVHDALHRRVDGVQRTPFDVADVRTRARQIQRRRTTAVVASVAAVLAIAVPVGLTMVGPAQRSDVPPATQPPAPIATGTVRVDPRSAPLGAGPGVPLVDVVGGQLVEGSEATPLPQVYDSITPYLDGWIATTNFEGAVKVLVLDADFDVIEGDDLPSWGITVSPDQSRIAWAEYDGGRWYVVDRAADGSRAERRTALPPGPEDAYTTTVGFPSDTEVAVSQGDPSGGPGTTWLADGMQAVELPGMIDAKTASAGSGLVAGLTESTVDSSCSGVFDVTAPTGTPVWETCDHQLVSFSPDGAYVAGFAAYGDANGSPTLAVLDAATGDVVVDYELSASRRTVAGIHEIAWEDDQTMLALGVSGGDQFVVRIGLDGTVERVDIDVANVDSGSAAIKLAASQAGT